ncbi:MAG: DUF1569 domain-containing protein [Pirellulaceae bacterium]
MVKTKNVVGRRKVRYDSYEDLLGDAQALTSSEVRTLGNWSFGQILVHVAQAIDSSIDGAGFALPWPLRWAMTLLMKKKFLSQALPPGFKSSPSFIPADDVSVENGLALLQKAVARQGLETKRAPHPAFGSISAHEWTDFSLRHAEMHMSFVVPDSLCRDFK